MKRILPTEKFTITTHLTPDRVKDKLLKFVEPYKSAKFLKFKYTYTPLSDKPYQGTVEEDFFEIRKILERRNRCSSTIIQGSISKQDREESLIEVKIKPDQDFNDGTLLFRVVMIPTTIIHFCCSWSSIQDNDISGSIIFFVGPIFM